MKRTITYLLLLLLLPTSLVQAQTAVTLESLEVELWPDYDQESVLVLLTGTLPANVPLPVTLTIPLPDNADFNVVARITEANQMTDAGMTPEVGENEVTFVLPDSRFRVEYYQPYTAANSQRSFTFSWQSEMAVEQMSVTLQQPFAATNVTLLPAAETSGERPDGLTYHVLPSQTVVAGDAYNVEVGYTMSTPALTVSFLTESEAEISEELPILEAVPVEGPNFDWPMLLIALGVLILVATAVWYFVSNRAPSSSSKRPTRPKPAHRTAAAPTSKAKTAANFCHQCGEAINRGDKFCRHCGTAVKQR